jgi:hypothetical protein
MVASHRCPSFVTIFGSLLPGDIAPPARTTGAVFVLLARSWIGPRISLPKTPKLQGQRSPISSATPACRCGLLVHFTPKVPFSKMEH